MDLPWAITKGKISFLQYICIGVKRKKSDYHSRTNTTIYERIHIIVDIKIYTDIQKNKKKY